MNEVVVTLLSIVALVILAALVCWTLEWVSLGLGLLFDRFRRQPEDTPEEYRARLREPQFDVLAAFFSATVPDSLKRLYQNTDLLEQEHFYLTNPHDPDSGGGPFISRFLPADQKALEAMPRKLRGSLFPFAEDGSGNLYCVRIEGEAREPCPVYLWNRKAASRGEGRGIADSLDEFLARPHRPGRASGAGA